MLATAFSGLSLSVGSRSSSFTSTLPSAKPVQPRAPVKAPLVIEDAHKKGAGSTKNGRDSNSKRLGVKVYGDQHIPAGGIIIRQRGNTWHPGNNVFQGKDYTLHAKIDGVVHFRTLARGQGTKFQRKIDVFTKEEWVEYKAKRDAAKAEAVVAN